MSRGTFRRVWLRTGWFVVIHLMILLLATALEPILKLVSWTLFGDHFLHWKLFKALLAGGIPSGAASCMADAMIYTTPTLAIYLAVLAQVHRRFPENMPITRCRNCKHVLQELHEARCPKCGEPI